MRQRTLHSGQRRIRARHIERDVSFDVPGGEVANAMPATYHSKYDREGPSTVGRVLSAKAMFSTLRLVLR